MQIRKFDPRTIGEHRVILIIGKRNTGKSVLAKDLLYHVRRMPVGVVMSGTEEGNGFFKEMVPDLFVYGDYDVGIVQRIVQRQRKLAKDKAPNSGTFVVLDDCMYDKRIVRDTVMRQIFMNGRHWNIFLILTAQYAMDLPPDIRANVDYVFVLRENIIQNRERLYKNFFGIFPTFDMFCQVMDQCTENYECLVLDNTAKSNKIEDVVFWYRGKDRGKFRMGSDSFWEHHRQHYNPRYDDAAGPDEDPGKARKKNCVKVSVVKKAR